MPRGHVTQQRQWARDPRDTRGSVQLSRCVTQPSPGARDVGSALKFDEARGSAAAAAAGGSLDPADRVCHLGRGFIVAQHLTSAALELGPSG